MKAYSYDVCLSFAGEQREYVERVADRLRQQGAAVFYDQYELAYLWGKDLYEHLHRVYSEESRFCVLFASREYADKVWTTHERCSAQERALADKGEEYILPARFDETRIPGLRDTVGHVDLARWQPETFADLIIEKLRLAGTALVEPADDAGRQTPRTRDAIDALLAGQDEFWEHKLFGGELFVGRIDLADKFMDHEMRLVRLGREPMSSDRVMQLFEDRLRIAVAYGDQLDRIFAVEAQEWAFGEPGVPGDARRIRHLARRYLELLEAMLDWAADLRSVPVPVAFVQVKEPLAQFLDAAITAMSDFVDEFCAQVDRFPEMLRTASEEPVHVEIKLTFTIDEEVLKTYRAGMARLGQRAADGRSDLDGWE